MPDKVLAYEQRNSKPVGYIDSYDEDTLLFVSGEGWTYLFDLRQKQFRPIQSNLDKLISDQRYIDSRFSIKDIKIANIEGRRSVLVSYNKLITSFEEDEVQNTNCYNTSILIAPLAKNIRLTTLRFKEFFSHNDCATYPFNAHSSGGRIVELDDDHLLFSTGEMLHGYFSQITENHLGKMLKINKRDKSAEVFSLGHRNPQGLFVDRDGNIFSTEHGPQGGDEVNLIKNGKNYGYPLVGYGTPYGFKDKNYGMMSAYFNPDHSVFKEPIFAFLPSIGISELVRYRGNLFSQWNGDLLVASMSGDDPNSDNIVWRHRGQSIFRIRFGQDSLDKAVNVERIFFGQRIRDLLVDEKGLIYMVTETPVPSITRLSRDDGVINHD